ncbi:Alpha-farnesene synthase [Bertholletia excelsa]
MEGARGVVADKQRRSGNYKPSIWKYDLLQSLASDYTTEEYKKCIEKLQREVLCMFAEADDMNLITKLEMIDCIEKLGLAYHFEEKIKETLDAIASAKSNNPTAEKDLHATAAALYFRLFRQHGYNVHQDILDGFLGSFNDTNIDMKAKLELLEACHLAHEGENMLDDAKSLSAEILKHIRSGADDKLSEEIAQTLDLPLHWRVRWYDVRRHIHVLGKMEGTQFPILVKLAKLNFNMVQAAHQEDLKELSRWWKNLHLIENLSFSRNRLVESYLWAMGVAFEPQHSSFRKWLTKAIIFVIVIDDLYDIYGSLEELECFTNAIHRWDIEEIQHLPECMKICLEVLYKTTNEVASEIQREKGWNSVLPYLQKAWVDFCKTLLEEAKWYNKGHTPSLQEYLDNGWISSSGAVLSLHALFSFANEAAEEVTTILTKSQELVHQTSLIIRLCNDLGTSAAELERGDAPSSLLCFMREANVSEEAARKHIRSLMMDSWTKLNHECLSQSPSLRSYAVHTTNMARVAHFIYQNGDGFGVPDRETRQQVLSILIDPITLN